ncbi:hypothetical protein FA10DRAFT_269949 [Acaromyces ingoldii]|uniref:Uncharacterized protein n=1 Tax=Acaromyces ingoldii TaxID=215250 RepID=A0A316YAK5_9BASI|nr:hypothetical protein FA10DRAFT_269949 [Acaromyces ingoldii]PWN86860.1 hypothetical protein FA10DRAFT_269949 [Acaromyces ingoldii]
MSSVPPYLVVALPQAFVSATQANSSLSPTRTGMNRSRCQKYSKKVAQQSSPTDDLPAGLSVQGVVRVLARQIDRATTRRRVYCNVQ